MNDLHFVTLLVRCIKLKAVTFLGSRWGRERENVPDLLCPEIVELCSSCRQIEK